MRSRARRLWLCLLVIVLAVSGSVFCFVCSRQGVAAQISRSFQVWPDRSIGIASGSLLGIISATDGGVLPSGVAAVSTGGVVRGRTYLVFSTDVFPAGTDIQRATLHFYVDSISRPGRALAGVYRVLEPWGATGWSENPATWPELLDTPQDVVSIEFDAVEGVRGLSPLSTATSPSSPLPTSTGLATHTPTPGAVQTPTTPSSPLPTPTRSPTPTPSSSPVPTPDFTPASPVQLVAVEGDWFTWDVTALTRSWLSGEVPNYGLAIGTAPDSDSGIDEAGNMLVARSMTAGDTTTRPYIVVEAEIRPVTPTPTGRPVLPPAGSEASSTQLVVVAVILLGIALLVTAVAVRRT